MHCPFCHSNKCVSSGLPDDRFNHKLFGLYTCADCSLLFVYPQPDADDLEKMYPPTYQHKIDKNLMNIHKKMPGLRFPYADHIRLIRKYSGSGKKIDFGCGNGHFINNLLPQGISMDGVEFSEEVVLYMKKEVPQVDFFTIREFYKSSSTYEVIRMSNVLEHFTSPVDEFRQLLERLDENGIILIEGPLERNISLVNFCKWNYFNIRKKINSNYTTSHPPTHIIFSDVQNQLRFFEQFSLKTEYYRVVENCWPYPEKINEIRSPGSLLKYFIGKLSIFISWFIPGYGNTFLYVGRKQ